MKIYDYKLTKLPSWCLVLCMSLFFMTNSLSAQDPVEEITCDDQVNISVGADCTFTITPGLFTEGDNTEMTVYFSNDPDEGYDVGESVELECGTYTVTVAGVSGNSCWGTVVVEDKLEPVGVNPCPTDGQPGVAGTDCNISCIQYANGVWPSLWSEWYNSLEDCSEPISNAGADDATFILTPNDDCTMPDILDIIYYPIDAKGNVGADTLRYFVHKFDAELDLDYPKDYEGTCEESRLPSNTGGPFIELDDITVELVDFNNPVEVDHYSGDEVVIESEGTAQLCDILVSYEDIDLPACDDGSTCASSLKIIRTWQVIDWCKKYTAPPYVQTIHLKDIEGPDIVGFYGETTFSVDPWLCEVERLTLPLPIIEDNCDEDYDPRTGAPGTNGSFDINIVGPPGVVVRNGVVYNAPKGEHKFDYYATDCCGNQSLVATVTIYVIDEVAPIAIAKQYSVVSLSNVPGNLGTAKIYAESIDNGSYDRCTDVQLEIRRDGWYDTDGSVADDLDYTLPHNAADVAAYCAAIGSRNPRCRPVLRYPCDEIGNDTYNTEYLRDKDGDLVYADCDEPFDDKGEVNEDPNGCLVPIRGHSWDLPAGFNSDIDPDGGKYVKFCCADLTAITVDANNDGVMDDRDMGYVKVWLRVWDNADMSTDSRGVPTYGTDGDYFNETWAYVKVEVSSPPELTVVNTSISCEWPLREKWEEENVAEAADPDNHTHYFLEPGGDWYDDYVTAFGICDLEITAVLDDQFVDDVCKSGYFRLIYTASNPDSKGLSVQRTQIINLGTEGDRLECSDIYWPASYTETDCQGIAMEPELNWEAAPCSLVGWTYRTDTFRFESDACVKIINEYTVVDWCAFDAYYDEFGESQVGVTNPTNPKGYFEGGHDYLDGRLCQDRGIKDYFDFPNDGGTTGDVSQNGVYKYVEVIKVVDDEIPEIETQDTMYAITTIDCFRPIQLEATASDASDAVCPATWFKWEITIDIGNDGFSNDRVFTTNLDRSRLRGEVLNFTPWRTLSNGARVPLQYGPSQFPVRFVVYDGCGNVDKEIRTIMVSDKKPPTPYCVSLSSAVMNSGSVELWAGDFDQGSLDNCSIVYTTFDEGRPASFFIAHYFDQNGAVLNQNGTIALVRGVGQGRPSGDFDYADASVLAAYDEGDIQKWIPGRRTSGKIFDCDDLGTTDVRMTAWDSNFNSDWCSVELTLIDNQGGCDSSSPRAAVSGNIATEENSDVALVEVTLENLSNPEYELTVTTGNDGDFAFASNPMYNGYDVSAVKDGDDTEGVSTLDLVLVQRHILGITPFDSPYKVIAADINSDRRVSGTDLVVLRKTILGIYKEFPTNNSWRFVEGSQALNVENALTDFNEVINIQDLDANMLNEDFVAVKIGDVNATARTNARDLGTQTRSAGTLSLGLNEQNVTKGQLIDLTFSSSDFNKVYGYQFTLELNGLTIESVQAGDASMTDANIGILDENTVTVSYSDMEGLGTSDNLFTLSAVATQSGTISEMIGLTSSALNSEGYVGEGLDIHTIELTIDGSEAASFRLDQNEPNPFDQVTVVGFELPTSGTATLTVYDVAGKIVTSLRGTYAQGYNEIKLNKEDLNTTGVLYYTLQSGQFTATKKMIIIE